MHNESQTTLPGLSATQKMPSQRRRSPLEAIRAFCIECQGADGYLQAVTECKDTACHFYDYRQAEPLEAGQHRPLAAIKAYCHDYCEVENCQGDTAILGPCPVFPFRLGVNPNIGTETREKQRQLALFHEPQVSA